MRQTNFQVVVRCSLTMPPFADRWVTGQVGVNPRMAEEVQELLEPGDKLRFVFEAETKRNIGRRLLYALFKGSLNTLGQIYVVITDHSVLLADREELLLGGRVVYAEPPATHDLRACVG